MSSHCELRLELPPLWQRVNVAAVVEAAAAIVSEDGALTREQAQVALMVLREASDVQHRSQVVLTAIRPYEEHAALDVLTIALPPAGAATGEYPPDEQSGALLPRPTACERVKRLQVSGTPAIEHSSVEDGESDPLFPSRVQLVIAVPPVGAAAIVTLLSSEPGAELRLELEAETIVASMSLASSPEEPVAAAGR